MAARPGSRVILATCFALREKDRIPASPASSSARHNRSHLYERTPGAIPYGALGSGRSRTCRLPERTYTRWPIRQPLTESVLLPSLGVARRALRVLGRSEPCPTFFHTRAIRVTFCARLPRQWE